MARRKEKEVTKKFMDAYLSKFSEIPDPETLLRLPVTTKKGVCRGGKVPLPGV